MARPPGRGTICAAGLLALALCGCRQEAQPVREPAPVVVQAAQLADRVSEIVLTGEIAARVTSELSFRVGGRITDRRVEVGDHVSADQVLATIDPQEQQANVDAARAGVQAAEAQLRQASSTFERQKALIQQGYTTRREYDAAEEAFRAGQGALNVARAQLGTAEDQLSQTVLKPGVAGVITARSAEAGQVVQSAQSVFTLAQDGPRDAVFDVHESIFALEPAGDTIQVALVSDPNVRAAAKLRETSPTVDPANGTVRVKFEIVDPPPAMTLGATVMGTGRLKGRAAITLPWSALSSQDGKPAVWTVDPQSKAVSLIPVSIASYEVGLLLVRDGLKPGQLVVTRGQQLLRPGETVDPVTEAKP
jgi:RND family efflux transporter MFP subunit